MFKVNNRNIKTRCEICSKSTIKSLKSLKSFPYLLFNIPYILFSRDHNENKAFKALFCVIPAITSQLVFNFLTDLFVLDIVIICSTDFVKFHLWRNIPTYLYQNDIIDVVLVSLLLTLDIFHTLF